MPTAHSNRSVESALCVVQVCVESGALEVTYVETRARLGQIDGRYPHWVAPHTGERYSIIYYVTNGPVAPQAEAVIGGEVVLDECT